jgi:septum formation protein
MRKIILASGSPRRREILRLSGIPFDIDVSEYIEDMTEKIPPEELAEKLALGKALTVSSRHPDAIIIGADTFIVFEESVLGKPHTREKAREMLSWLSGKPHVVLTGYAIVDTKDEKQVTGVSVNTVIFRDISDSEIEAYIATGEPLERAGGYAIQGGAAGFVKRIEGDYLGIVGLPLAAIVEELQAFNIHG